MLELEPDVNPYASERISYIHFLAGDFPSKLLHGHRN
jgi:hypothetical protein